MSDHLSPFVAATAGSVAAVAQDEETSRAHRKVLLRKRTYNGSKRKWSPWTAVHTRSERSEEPSQFVYKFPPRSGGEVGGQLVIYGNLLDISTQKAVTNELMECTLFRQYFIQGSPEPRTHFLLHELATGDFSDQPQPGYRYGCIRMKARPLHLVPEIQRLATDLQKLILIDKHHPCQDASTSGTTAVDATTCSIEDCFWNIGVNPVLYRDGRDRIGYHADDDQGEDLILTALVSSPANGATRRISIRHRHFKTQGNMDGDEELELLLDAGDAYSMDGEMQKHYVHSVPCDTLSVCGGDDGLAAAASAQQRRIAVVFRRGRFQRQRTDSGRSSASLAPRVRVPYRFGGDIPDLHEGLTYTRVQLLDMCAHRSSQKGVSGNRDDGCDSIIVSGLRADGLGDDNMLRLMYAASTREGALSILRSKVDVKPIRVFRSSVLNSRYRALSEDAKASSSARYRFDGVYWVETIRYRDERMPVSDEHDVMHVDIDVPEPVAHLAARIPPTRIYFFYLVRVGRGPGALSNRIKSHQFIHYCIEQKSMSPEALDDATETERMSPGAFECSSRTEIEIPAFVACDEYGRSLDSFVSSRPAILFDLDFLCANALHSLRSSTGVEPVFSPGLHLLSGCIDSQGFALPVFSPGLQLLSDCEDSPGFARNKSPPDTLIRRCSPCSSGKYKGSPRIVTPTPELRFKVAKYDPLGRYRCWKRPSIYVPKSSTKSKNKRTKAIQQVSVQSSAALALEPAGAISVRTRSKLCIAAPSRISGNPSVDAENTTAEHMLARRSLRLFIASTVEDPMPNGTGKKPRIKKDRPNLKKPSKQGLKATPELAKSSPSRRRSPRLSEALCPAQATEKPAVRVARVVKKSRWGCARTKGTSRLHHTNYERTTN